MSGEDMLRLVLALVFVLALMGGLSIVLKRLGFQGSGVASSKRRLKIVESLGIDSRRRLMIVQCDDRQHLVICGPEGETVIETAIPAPAAPVPEQITPL